MDPVPCRSVPCPFLTNRTVEFCFREHCPHAHVRRREEDQAARDRRDRLEGRVAANIAAVNPEPR